MPPIKPSEVKKEIPEVVFECFNRLINEKFGAGGEAIVDQNAVIALLEKMGINSDQVFEKGWLDVEDAYRAVGWEVKYDKPAFNESGEAYFTFTKRKNGSR